MNAPNTTYNPRLDAANEAQSRQALDSTRLGGGGFCLVCGTALVATDPPGNTMCRTCLNRADLSRLTVQPVVTTGVPVVKKNDPVARRRAGYTCPGCGAVFGTNIKLAAHFADCPNCEGAADWARVRVGLPIRSK